MADTYFSREFSGASRQTWTFSCWFKRSKLSTTQTLFSSGTSSTERSSIFIEDTTSTIRYYSSEGAAVAAWTASQAVLRDPSAWYHFVCKYDTTQATATDRIKFYLNGEAMTHQTGGITTYPALNNATGYIGSNDTHGLGCLYYGATQTEFFDGYMAHVNFTDGTAYDASAFGETDTNGQWKPKTAPSVTYGTNGFFLKFASSGSLGTDSSGNGNDFTKNGSGDQVTDTPDNVFATLNSVEKIDTTPSEGNCQFNGGAVSLDSMRGTIGMPTGKWYWEVKVIAIGVGGNIGIATNDSALSAGGTLTGVLQQYSGFKSINGWSNNGSYGGFTTGDIIGVALDMDSGSIEFYKNGSSQGVAYASLDTSLTFFPFVQGSTSLQYGLNFGNPSFAISSGNTDDNGYGNFEYAPPSGYLALCTQNLATELSPTIDDGSQYFNIILWTGDGSNPRSLTGVGFQPDWTWTKARNAAFGHNVYDSSRGNDGTAYYRLETQNSDTEIAQPPAGHVTSLDSDGFSVTNGSSSDNIVNNTGTTYVAWNWLVNGGSTSSNTDGTITSTVQVNSTAGFSIVTYTGNGTAGATVGHGLGVKPSWFVVKGRDQSGSWVTYHTSLGATKGIPLQSTSAAVTTSAYWNNAEPTSSVITLGYDGPGNEVNNSGTSFVAYCFADIEGYSKFGSYTGNGNTNGTFIYTGFRPAFVIIKRTDSTGQWTLIDTTRQDYNLNDRRFHPNLSDAEYSGDGYGWDMLSNGFKQRSTSAEFNGSGASFIYIAFAENPFVDSTGRPVTAR